jgi:hypothetical protein
MAAEATFERSWEQACLYGIIGEQYESYEYLYKRYRTITRPNCGITGVARSIMVQADCG